MAERMEAPQARVQIKINLFFKSNFFVGGGKGDNMIDNYLLRDGKGDPMIPGSSLKGLLRHQMKAIYVTSGGACSYTHQHDSRQSSCVCPVCLMCGGPGNQRGRLQFGNLVANLEQAEIHVRSGIRIDRWRGVVADGALWRYQTARLAPGQCLKGVIRGYLPKAEAAEYLCLFQAAFNSLDAIGANKSRGCGWIDHERSALEISLDGQPWSVKPAKEE